MQLIVDIQNELLMKKIIQLLNVFSSDGVKVQVIDTKKKSFEVSDEYIEKNWREIGMNTHSANLEDDERMYEAASEFYNEKHSS